MTKNNTPILLSLVVPTKNRAKYAQNMLEGLQAVNSGEIEIIIQDNSDQDKLGEYVAALDDKRIRYYHCAEPLSLHQNMDLGVDKARGHYVCVLGDDDGIFVDAALASLREAKRLGADALLTEICSYSWPGTKHWLWGDIGGMVSSKRVYPRYLKQLLNPDDALDDLFKRGAVGGLGLLPRVYQGYVSRQSLCALKKCCGTYFPGGSPDMANAVALVAFIDKMLLDPRLTLISGHSPESGGGQGSAGRHHAELDQASHLPSDTIKNWDSKIPQFWSGTTIYAQSAIEAARAVNLVSRYEFNYAMVCIACLIYEPKIYRKHIYAALDKLNLEPLQIFHLFSKNYVAMTMRRIITFLHNISFYYLKKGKQDNFENIKDIMAQGFRSYP